MAIKLPERIFVVDDERTIAVTLALILQKHGYPATAFVNSLDALQAMRSHAPDLVTSDVMMPQLSGVDLAVQIRLHCPKRRILLFSGQAETAELLSEARARGYDFNPLAKPVHPSDLLKTIREQVSRSSPDCS